MIKLSGYKILKKIGSGGMGDVYLAEHEKLEKKVAIKSLHKNLATDTSFRERFSQEAKTHSKLDHPNIVKLLDYKERKDGLFLIMEYVDGKQLDEHIKKVSGPIPEQQLTALFCQILDAIGYAHKKSLIHRDIKPSNIMIDKKGRIKVLDFGIAKMQEEEKGLTKTGIQLGTASYMSPEQVNAKKVDKLTDIYSLGVTLFYMAVGKSPYDGETNTFTIQEKIVRTPFPAARDAYPGVSEKFEHIIHKATQKNKKDRYKNCKEFKDDFDIINLKNNSKSSKNYLKKNKEYLNSNLKNFNSKNIEVSKSAILTSIIFFLLIAVGLIYNISEKLSAEEYLKVTEKQLDNLQDKLKYTDYDSGCNKRGQLKIHNMSTQDLYIRISYKKKNGKWSEWMYWEFPVGQYNGIRSDDEEHNGGTIYTTDYRYYIMNMDYENYLYSYEMPHITNICNAKCINIY